MWQRNDSNQYVATAIGYRKAPHPTRVAGIRSGLGIRAGTGVAVAALVLPAGTARAWVVASGARELVVHGRARAGLHVRPAVDRRGRVLQSLRPARGKPGRDRRILATLRTLTT